MREYAIYDVESGEVEQNMVLAEEVVHLVADGEVKGAVLGHLDASTHYVLWGSVLAYDAEAVALKASRPSQWHRWSNTSMGWFDTRTRDALAADLSAQVNARREVVMSLPILVGEIEIDADAVSVSMLQGRISAMRERDLAGITASPDALVWRDAGNVTHTWTSQAAYLAWLVDAALAIEERSTAIYMHSWDLKARLSTASDPTSIDINQGWPVAG